MQKIELKDNEKAMEIIATMEHVRCPKVGWLLKLC